MATSSIGGKIAKMRHRVAGGSRLDDAGEPCTPPVQRQTGNNGREIGISTRVLIGIKPGFEQSQNTGSVMSLSFLEGKIGSFSG